MMAKPKISLNEISERVDLTLSNFSILKTGKAKAILFSTLDASAGYVEKERIGQKSIIKHRTANNNKCWVKG